MMICLSAKRCLSIALLPQGNFLNPIISHYIFCSVLATIVQYSIVFIPKRSSAVAIVQDVWRHRRAVNGQCLRHAIEVCGEQASICTHTYMYTYVYIMLMCMCNAYVSVYKNCTRLNMG